MGKFPFQSRQKFLLQSREKFPFQSRERSSLLSCEFRTVHKHEVRFGEIFVLTVPGITYAISLVTHQSTVVLPKQGRILQLYSLKTQKGRPDNRLNVKFTS